MLLHKFGHGRDSIWRAALEDTKWRRQDAKLVTERDADPPLAGVQRKDAPFLWEVGCWEDGRYHLTLGPARTLQRDTRGVPTAETGQ